MDGVPSGADQPHPDVRQLGLTLLPVLPIHEVWKVKVVGFVLNQDGTDSVDVAQSSESIVSERPRRQGSLLKERTQQPDQLLGRRHHSARFEVLKPGLHACTCRRRRVVAKGVQNLIG